jgi:2-polyprenyl-6-methoxyphenol hydroxylase-like FAD-dependent oxidoreductase
VRKILIVGAGQAGLQLALSLQAASCEVTVMPARTPDEIRAGWPTSTQVMMYRALDRERDVKLNFWDETARPSAGSASTCRLPRPVRLLVLRRLGPPG